MPAPGARIDVQESRLSIARITLELHFNDTAVANLEKRLTGQSFDLRLVDCFDERAATAEVHRQLAPAPRDQPSQRPASIAERSERVLRLAASWDQLLYHD